MNRPNAGIKNELRAFYANQGLTGKHLRKALRHDMKAAARNIQAQGRTVVSDIALVHSFGWDQSPEGLTYWAMRSVGLNYASRSLSRQFN